MFTKEIQFESQADRALSQVLAEQVRLFESRFGGAKADIAADERNRPRYCGGAVLAFDQHFQTETNVLKNRAARDVQGLHRGQADYERLVAAMDENLRLAKENWRTL